MNDVNWSVFSQEEQEAIKKIIEMGERDSIVGGVVEMTPAKEFELQKIALDMRPIPMEFESTKLKEYEVARIKAGLSPSPQSPAEEAELQKILDEERLEFMMEHQAKNEARLEKVETLVKSNA